MKQAAGERKVEQEIRSRIETAYNAAILQDEPVQDTTSVCGETFSEIPQYFPEKYCRYKIVKTDNETVFTVTDNELQSMLSLASCPVAMRKNLSFLGKNREPCMADIVRADTNLITKAFTKEVFQNKGYMKKLISGALAYQEQLNIPLCFVETEQKEFFEHFGFHYIYDRPQYALNTDMISEGMLARALDGETIPLNSQDTTLKAADSDSLLSLAHFVNANLCRHYGLFVIRSAAYYEHFLEEIQSTGGNLFLIMENGKLKGYFAYAKKGQDIIREAVFENESDIELYLLEKREKKPAVMARIVNLPEMLKHISGNGKITIAIRLIDPVLSINDGIFIWYIDEKGSHMERVSETQSGDEPSMRPEVTATIGELTAFIFEYIKLKHNAKFDNIYLAGPAWMAG